MGSSAASRLSDSEEGGALFADAWGREGAAQLEEVAKLWRQAMVSGGSVLFPGQSVWTQDNAKGAYEAFNAQPDIGGDSFDVKLERQFAGAPTGAIQLFAEVYTLMLQPLQNYRGSTKRDRLRSALGMASLELNPPRLIQQALDHRIFNGGQAFTSGKWRPLQYLVEVAVWITGLDHDDRVSALSDPLGFRGALDDAVEESSPSQRAALLYVLYPQYFLPIVSEHHKKQVVAGLADPEHAMTDDLDRELHQIHDDLLDAVDGQPVDLYDEPYYSRWAGGALESRLREETPEAATMRAWLLRRGSGSEKNLFPVWRDQGRVTLSAANLRHVDSHIGYDDLKEAVDEDYAHVSYNARAEKVDDFHTFLNRMKVGDLVVAIDRDALYRGTIDGEAKYEDSAGGSPTLSRRVAWWTDHGVELGGIPSELAARLKTQRDLVDLTQHLDTLLALTSQAADATSAPDDDVELPAPTDELADELNVDVEWLEECVALLEDRPQMIFYGPPGTGKTYIAKHLAKHLAGDRVRLVQFHPSYSYEDFFEGYRPEPGGGFKLSPGPMRKLVDQALESRNDPVVLIIDEINRGNLAKVFGELYFLLEYRDESIELLYGDEDFSLPKNIFIIGTMNTVDRSIALVDSAMRRRFSFLPLHPSEAPTKHVLRRWLAKQGHDARVADLLDALNEKIPDPDFKVGPSYLMRAAVHKEGGLERTWRTAILPLLEEHFYGEKNAAQVANEFGLAAIDRATKAAEQPVEDLAPEPDDPTDTD